MLPQALQHVMPSYKTSIKSLIKGTAVVGYVAVQDLTKMGDIVRSRVFYMDQGGIYEDGTPDQIFDNPQKDRTRRFVRRLKVLELTIDGPDFDFAGAQTEINGYCLQNDISSRTKYSIKLAFEELICHILRPVLDYAPVLISIEHSAKDGRAEITASYGGDRFDPAASGDGFSYNVLASMVESLTYSYDADAEQTNSVHVVI